MREELKKLKRLRDTLVGLEMELSVLEQDLTAIRTDLNYLYKLQDDLEENIRILKKEKVIAMAEQYKKSIDELEKTKKLIRDRINIEIRTRRRFQTVERRYKTYNKDYKQLYKQVQNHKVVLLFDPSKRKKK
jgi:hypothetical protein